jgi:fluoroquinolone resistance protein
MKDFFSPAAPAETTGETFREINFAGGSATGKTFDECVWERCDGSRASFSECEFSGCVFETCRFSEATFARCRFLECEFRDCDLSLWRPTSSRFREVIFRGCKLLGANWSRVRDGQLQARFEACALDLSVFDGLSLRGSALIRCLAREASFCETDLSGVDCRETDFEKAVFLQAKLAQADFRDARNYSIDATANKIAGAKFSLPEAVSLLRGLGIVLEDA